MLINAWIGEKDCTLEQFEVLLTGDESATKIATMRVTRRRWVRLGVILVATAAMVVGGLVLVRDPSQPSLMSAGPGVLRSYEFTIEIASGQLIPDEPNGLIKGWFEAPFRTRWELGPIDPQNGETAIFLVTEEGSWFYDPDSRTYSHSPGAIPEFKDRPVPLVSNLLIGAVISASLIDDAMLRASPRERMLGREVAVVDSGQSQALPRGLDRNVSLWVDLEYRVVLREVTDTAGGSYDAKVVRLQFNRDVDDRVFQFEPPANARVAIPEPTPDLSMFPTPGPSVFLEPAYVPAGFARTGSRSQATVGDRSKELQESTYTGNGGEIVLRQETYDGEALLPLGTFIKVGSADGTYVMRGDEMVLSWYQDGLRLSLESSILSLGELLKIAESME